MLGTAKKKLTTWGLIWRGALILLMITIVLFTLLLGFGVYLVHKGQVFWAQSQRERNLETYDVFWTAISDHYFDPKFGGLKWAGLRAEGRAKAAKAANGTLLYTEVLMSMAQMLPSSHVAAIMADAAQDKPKTGPAKGPVMSGVIDYGFDFVCLRRLGTQFCTVGDVKRGSAADAAGIEPGWVITYSSTTFTGATGTVTQAHFKADVYPFIADHGHFSFRNGRPEMNVETGSTDFRTTVRHIEYDLPLNAAATPPFAARRLPSGALYVRFDNFGLTPFDNKAADEAIAELNQADARGVIIDLRHNTGGDVVTTMRFISHFLPALTEVGFFKGRKFTDVKRTDFWSRRYHGPVIVLIGPGAYSGAELTAAALKYYHRATLIGRTTNGSMLESRYFSLPDGGKVQVAVADFHTPDGQRIEDAGVKPDIEVIPTLAEIRTGHDPVLERAEAVLAKEAPQR
ncbi:S41 family peptidase [Asticcacaulis sp. EMRT-3]|uniref:S41 family peptidase n=1 Tax=Asticcacaulis sp. EMRT-3 TaxID=3040349 RepID=UPI0024AF39A5|nr:S41 family peptidase [Asticcacaulis sp. EMRT-3]MDI7776604.1 S41 family peptidase [Asticcacaulis sp. EMRT-3]